MKDWRKKGIESWKINRNKQLEREKEEKVFVEKWEKKKKEKTLLESTRHRNEVLEGLDEFEDKLENVKQQSQIQ